MDTLDLPENEPEEITWQDDENRATLFLRSFFIALSGIILLKTQLTVSYEQPWQQLLYLLGLNILLPVCIVWFFCGQGLRAAEWLTDQKYNAWNYGVNFKDWKTHLKWTLLLLALAFVALLIHSIRIQCRYGEVPIGAEWIFEWAFYAFGAACVVSLICGYLWFGCAQGFGAAGATLAVTGIVALCLLPFYSMQPRYVVACICFALISSGICWKTRSIAPMLYAALLSAPMLALFLRG